MKQCQGTQLWEREHRQRVREVANEAILKKGLELRKEELLHVVVGDINPISEVLPTPRRNSWRQYIPTWGTPTQVLTTSTYAPQT
jgi:hypothetical protein